MKKKLGAAKPAKPPRAIEVKPFAEMAAIRPQSATTGGDDRRSGQPPEAVADSGDEGRRVFSQLVDAVVPGWNVFDADYANHVARGWLITETGAPVAVLTYNSDEPEVCLRVRLVLSGIVPDRHLRILFRIQERHRIVHIIPDFEHAAATVMACCPCLEGTQVEALLSVMVCRLRDVLDDGEFSDAIGLKGPVVSRLDKEVPL